MTYVLSSCERFDRKALVQQCQEVGGGRCEVILQGGGDEISAVVGNLGR